MSGYSVRGTMLQESL